MPTYEIPIIVTVTTDESVHMTTDELETEDLLLILETLEQKQP